MTFSIDYPREGDKVLSVFSAFGSLGSGVCTVAGLAMPAPSNPTPVVFATRMVCKSGHWTLVFTDLQVGKVYDVEVTDQHGNTVARVKDVKVLPNPQGLTIQYPSSNDTVPDYFVANGITDQSTSDSLDCMKMSNATDSVTGTQTERFLEYWAVEFSDVPEGSGYTLEINHDSSCTGVGDSKSNLTVEDSS